MGNLLLLLFIELLLFFISFILSDRDILAPSVMMCVMFVISTLFALLNIHAWNSIVYELETTLIISCGIIVFIISENIYKLVFCRRNKTKNKGIIQYQFQKIEIPKYYQVILLFINIFVIVWYYSEIVRIVTAWGINATNIFAAYRNIYNKMNVAFESNDVEMVSTLLSQFMKVTKGAGFICLYLLITEIITSKQNVFKVFKSNILLLLNILLSTIPSLMLAGRNDLLQLMTAGLVYYYVVWHRYNGWHRNISWKYIKWGIGIIIVGMPCFYGLLFLLGRSTTKSMFEYVSIYIGSPIALFNDFLKTPVEPPRVFGEETLLGVHQLLYRFGIPTYVKNRHLEFRYLNDSYTSNIYTFFRRPIHDFGIGGMLLFTACVSFFFAWLYYSRIKKVYTGRKLDFRIITYGYLYYWIIYTSIDQRSISMISLTTIITFIIIYFELVITTRLRFSLRKKKYSNGITAK